MSDPVATAIICHGNLNGHTCSRCLEEIRPRFGCGDVVAKLLLFLMLVVIIALTLTAIGDALDSADRRITSLERRIDALQNERK